MQLGSYTHGVQVRTKTYLSQETKTLLLYISYSPCIVCICRVKKMVLKGIDRVPLNAWERELLEIPPGSSEFNATYLDITPLAAAVSRGNYQKKIFTWNGDIDARFFPRRFSCIHLHRVRPAISPVVARCNAVFPSLPTADTSAPPRSKAFTVFLSP